MAFKVVYSDGKVFGNPSIDIDDYIKDDVDMSVEPKLPGYGDKKKRSRKGYRDQGD